MAQELVGATEAATRLGLTSERIRQLAKAGDLPSPAGRVGRQELWRWQELEDWAVASGRLPRNEPAGRQLVRAWAPGKAQMRRVVDEVLAWDSGRSHAHVRIWEPESDVEEPAIVVIGNLEDSRGSSITNAIEDVATLVAAKHLGPAGLQAQYYEHWSRGISGLHSFSHVTFTVTAPGGRRSVRARGVNAATARALGGVLTDPSWRETDLAEVERLVGEPVEVYTAGTYTSAMLTAVQCSPQGAVSAVWDPDNATTADRAYASLGNANYKAASLLDGLLPRARAVLALYAVDARERAAAQLAWQDPDAPVQLELPPLVAGTSLRRAADQARHDLDHGELWKLVSAARARLAAIDAVERQLLVPARGGGLSRLAWWEAGTEEPTDQRDGMLGPIVIAADLLPHAARRADLPEHAVWRAVERAALHPLQEQCRSLDDWDVPLYRPAGPFQVAGPTARRYLDSVAWQDLSAKDQPRAERLKHLESGEPAPRPRKGSGGRRFGFDTAGRLVTMNHNGRTFCLEWPVGAGKDLTSEEICLEDGVVRADPYRAKGAEPVWIELPDGRVLPLPSRERLGPSHDYTWGYSGTGPSNLVAAIAAIVMHAAQQSSTPVNEDVLAAVVHKRVRTGKTPAWRVSDLLGEATQVAA